MHFKLPVAAFGVFVFGVLAASVHGAAKPEAETVPSYPDATHMNTPVDYREWIYLSTGLDMSYAPRIAGTANHSMFDNVFVNPEAYRYFKQNGVWPDKTVMVLEVRGAEGAASINKSGHFQSESLMGAEAHVKDNSRGGWTFYSFDGNGPGTLIPKAADCYSCHEAHGAVDTTFVQFYPTLMPIARDKKTLSTAYQRENSGK
ncbi:MAG TPA: cytochrome P460 family protein [Terriglobales bacterium]|jgi:hypothetical protein|nr:cytochrome P460 family protein [Terriglobales bacterium]